MFGSLKVSKVQIMEANRVKWRQILANKNEANRDNEQDSDKKK